jgi:Phage baseplate assembly protein W
MSYIGMNSKSGRTITDMDHINQSIKDILTTPIGSRIERRNYGSLLFLLLDNPNTEATKLRVISATVLALTQWEPRIKLDTVDVFPDKEKLTLQITGSRIDKPNQTFTSEIEVATWRH